MPGRNINAGWGGRRLASMRASETFYFPLLFVGPDRDWEAVDAPPFRLARRLWETSTFDLATLATRHRLHLPYQMMDVMLGRCNLEVRIDATELDDAIEWLHALLLGLYTERISPTVAPFATTHSINDYSGINSRDSDLLREKLPEGLRVGLTSGDATVEAWPVQLTFHCRVISEGLEITPAKFTAAVEKAKSWRDLELKHSSLRVVRDAAQAAPLLSSTDQSLLHVWCALEALFPKASTEVSFRVGLYIAQLASLGSRQEMFKRARAAYSLRSRVAHGSYRDVTSEEWREAWELLMLSADAILRRCELPTEDGLLDELLAREHDEGGAGRTGR